MLWGFKGQISKHKGAQVRGYGLLCPHFLRALVFAGILQIVPFGKYKLKLVALRRYLYSQCIGAVYQISLEPFVAPLKKGSSATPASLFNPDAGLHS